MVKSSPINESFESSINPQKAYLRKRAWNDEEDQKLIQLVKIHGPFKWSFIASQMIERVGKQCRERWHNHLNPRIKKEIWSEAEEWNLYLAHQLLGNKWADISKTIMGRTDNSIKNHWNSTMRKKMDGYRQKLLQAIHMFKTLPQKFSKKYNSLERTLIKDIVKENCLEKKQPEKKSNQVMTDDMSLGQSNMHPLLKDFKKLTLESFNDEEFVEDLTKMVTENELSYHQMLTVMNFIETNEEEIMVLLPAKDRYDNDKHEMGSSPISNNFQTPIQNDNYEHHGGRVPAAFDDDIGDDFKDSKNENPLLIPTFFVNPINLNITRSLFESHPRTPPKVDFFQNPRAGNDNRYQMLSILKVMNEENGENTSLVSIK